ncbi:MAG: nitroreductase [Promethearchaeota archaeon]|nr:MAG: nitroreductase [Candidatus Lokiarchaeota archaeon]
MNVKETIKIRRSYRALDPVQITKELITDLAESAQMAPSCKNSQPWRFIFVYDKDQLKKLFTSLIPGNQWIQRASMIIVVFSNVKYDCIIKERLYYLFDSGIATGFLLLRATELGLVAHPIAGFEENVVKTILEIPHDMRIISLIIVGKKSKKVYPELTDLMKKTEARRPGRFPLKNFAYTNKYNQFTLD